MGDLCSLVVVTLFSRGARRSRELAPTSASGSGLTTQIGWARLMPCRAPPSGRRAPASRWADKGPAVAGVPCAPAAPHRQLTDSEGLLWLRGDGSFSGTRRGRLLQATRSVKTEGGRSNNAFELPRAVSCHRLRLVLVQEALPSLGRAAQQRR